MNQNDFDDPYIDVDEWRHMPVSHRYVHGGFTGTDTQFSYYFPPEAQYEGRFFQYITPVPDNETLSQGASGEDDRIGFAIASGAYFIETNGGGSGATAGSAQQSDPTVTAYRANAAAAIYSRVVAVEMYGSDRPYGYAFGGSGGAYRTIGGMENTEGVWDGAVPYVAGSPMAIPNVFSVRMHAMRILQDKFPQIVDALEPGGSGDMYAGLNAEEQQALREVTGMGFPPKSWFGYKTMGVQAFPVLYQTMLMIDPHYFEEFWTVPGYLGADFPESFHGARLQHNSTVQAIISVSQARELGLTIVHMPGTTRGTADQAWQLLEEQSQGLPVAFKLVDTMPKVGFLGGDLFIHSGDAAGHKLAVRAIEGALVILGMADPRVLPQIKPGDKVLVDNSNFLAAQTYHRHQVPGADYPVWDQYRDAGGKPVYPQRPLLMGPMLTANTCGAAMSGKFKGKMIMVESLWDREAYPWQADWYRSKVKENLGDSIDEQFRLWFVDRAVHGDIHLQEDPTRIVSYLGVLHQALRDVSAWVEEGAAPPASTSYRVVDGQVIVPAGAAERKGIQPVILLTVNNSECAVVDVGQPVHFTAVIDVPPRAGPVVGAAWDFEGEGSFPVVEHLEKPDTVETSATVIKRTATFTKPGTYFAVFRAVTQRQGDTETPYARIQNLGRVRVVVK